MFAYKIAPYFILDYIIICAVFVILVISRLGFEGWIWVLIVLVPDLCILPTFTDCCTCQLVNISSSHALYSQRLATKLFMF